MAAGAQVEDAAALRCAQSAACSLAKIHAQGRFAQFAKLRYRAAETISEVEIGKGAPTQSIAALGLLLRSRPRAGSAPTAAAKRRWFTLTAKMLRPLTWSELGFSGRLSDQTRHIRALAKVAILGNRPKPSLGVGFCRTRRAIATDAAEKQPHKFRRNFLDRHVWLLAKPSGDSIGHAEQSQGRNPAIDVEAELAIARASLDDVFDQALVSPRQAANAPGGSQWADADAR